MQQATPPGDKITIRGSLNFFYLLLTLVARCVTPFMRDRIGARAQGLFSVIAGVLMFYAAMLSEDRLFLYYVVAWLGMTIAQRIDSARFRTQSRVHSQYSGRPALANLLGFKNEATARLIVEPLLCFGAAFVLSHWSMNVGKLVGAAGCALMLLEQMDRRMIDAREQAAIDARLESEQLANGVRDRLGY